MCVAVAVTVWLDACARGVIIGMGCCIIRYLGYCTMHACAVFVDAASLGEGEAVFV